MAKVMRFTAPAVLVWGLFSNLPATADDAPAPAAAESSSPAQLFTQLDANKDGQLTSDEVPEDRKRLFDRLVRTADKNQDGKLTTEEFAAGLNPDKSAPDPSPGERPEKTKNKPGKDDQKPNPQKLFRRLDTNGDGKLTADEVPEPRRANFERQLAKADKDGDKALSPEEFAASIRDAVREKIAKRAKSEGRPDGAEMFRRLDKDGDGKVTADEVQQVPEERRKFVERMLKRADENSDGVLTQEEFSAGLRRARPDGQGATDGARRPPVGGNNRPPIGGLFTLLDADHDGTLSSGEIAAASEIVRKLDRNGDGSISVPEWISRLPRPGAPE